MSTQIFLLFIRSIQILSQPHRNCFWWKHGAVWIVAVVSLCHCVQLVHRSNNRHTECHKVHGLPGSLLWLCIPPWGACLRIDPLDIPVSTETPAAEEPRSGFPDETATLLLTAKSCVNSPGMVALSTSLDKAISGSLQCLLAYPWCIRNDHLEHWDNRAFPPALHDRTNRRLKRTSLHLSQVKLLSLSNTISRITVGVLADFISLLLRICLAALARSSEASYNPHRIPLALFAHAGVDFHLDEQQGAYRDDIWTLSIGTGMGYSAVFTVLPSIISSIWECPTWGETLGS
ncbi:hypothetical protein D9611_004597 [Ephemerocybe angulata]|uniref:Uncharacterized protein n=1 Tax=Ephemerocybe angulata TaxID=980116 RepID=A0A8H5B391_9AGAR|nr:hypothetical protein D9611_004597 [Tulosesus angulatus]